MTEREWLDGLKAGDDVYLAERIHTVSHATNTQVVVAGYKFRRRDGRQIGGDGWHRLWLEQPTDELRRFADDRRRRALAMQTLERLYQSDCRKGLSTSQLESLAAAVDQILPKRKAGDA